MILKELIAELKRRNVKISIQSNNLKINAPESALDDELIQNIKLFKKELIEILGGINKDEKSFVKCSPKKQYYPLSPAQRRMYLLQGMDPLSVAYNIPVVFPLEQGFDAERLEGVLRALITRHESFRTSFQMLGEFPVQRIHGAYAFSVGRKSVRPDEVEGERAAFTQPFDLGQHPLLRAMVLDVAGEIPLLLLDMHHIVSDGVSHSVLADEFGRLYRGEGLRPLRLQYKDYSEWQQESTYQTSLMGQRKYWEGHFDGVLPVLDLPVDVSRSRVLGEQGKCVSFSTDEDLTDRIKEICRREGLTLYMFLLGAFKILLARLSGQEDILVGSPTSGRRHADLESTIGMFVNTLVLRSFPSAEKRVDVYMQELKQEVLTAFENQDYPYEELVEHLQPNREVGRNPLFDAMFVLQNQNESGEREWALGEISLQPGASKFDLMLQAVDGRSRLLFTYEYSPLFEDETIHRFMGYYKALLFGLTARFTDTIASIRMVSDFERSRLLYEFNSTQRVYPKDKTLVELFDEQVDQSGDKIALMCDDQWLSYREMNRNANQLANYLRHRGVCRHSVVGVMFDESLQGIVSILSVLKVGATYLPVSPQYPMERQSYLVRNADCSLLLTSKAFAAEGDRLGGVSGVATAHVDRALYWEERQEFEPVKGGADDVAYIMYTSGTSGVPKGVMVSHRNVVRLVKGTTYVSFGEGDRILQTGALEFDASTFEIWGALLNGLGLILFSKERLLLPQELKRAITRYSISTMWLTSSLFNFFADSDLSLFSGLLKLLVGGDALSQPHIRRLQEAHPGIEVINGYGPTENTTFSTTYTIDKSREIIPIGKPITNSTAFIVDHSDQLCPIGVYGELLVGGDGLSRGYLNDPELTASKYCATIDGLGVLYRTGDLVRWLPDGNIEFRGRKDDQVKIRGFRVEPREVERFIGRMDVVKEVYVHVLERSSGKALCAYYTSDKDCDLDRLREALSEQIPAYMVPTYFVRMDCIPLTANGKVDRKALPDPADRIEVGDSLSKGGAVFNKLRSICSEILEIEVSGIHTSSNFFHIGGHSLKAATLVGRIKKEFNVDISLKDIFQRSEVGLIAQHILLAKKEEYTSIGNAEKKQYYLLSPAQRRMHLLQQMDLDSVVYNMPYTMPLGTGIDRSKVEGVFRQLIFRHESFRTSFEVLGEEPVQRVHEKVDFKVEAFTIEKSEELDVRSKFIKPFDLSRAPLLRVAIVEIRGEGSFLLLDMHHIISDGVSHSVLAAEFDRLYRGESLRPLRLQYKDYSERQNSDEHRVRVKEQENYWIRKFEGELPILSLPAEYVRPNIQSHEGASVSFALSKEETKKLRTLVQENGLTQYMSILSAFTVLLSRLSGQEDIIIGTPIAGRNHPDLEGIVGMFVNTLAIRSEVRGIDRVTNFVNRLKQNTLEAFEHQDYQFEDLVERVSVSRDASRNPVFDVMFSLQNQGSYSSDLSRYDNQGLIHTERVSKFDLTLTAVDYGEQLLLSIEYCTKLFRAETIERFIGYFRRIVNQIADNPEMELSGIELISADEKHQLLFDLNDTHSDYPKDKTIHQLFEEQVEKMPDRIVVIKDDVCISYHELNRKSNQIAWHLMEKGIGIGGVVGLMSDRSEFLIAGILGILKSGAAYLPINNDWTEERIRFMLSDSCCSVMLYEKEQGRYDIANCSFLDIYDVNIYDGNTSNPNIQVKSSNISYIIYTSGTTGVPKGVLTTHSNVTRVVLNSNYLSIDKSDRILQLSSYTFDGSVFDIYGALLNGSSLIMINKDDILSIDRLLKIILRKQVSKFFITTALFNTIVDYGISKLKGVKKILFGGERISHQHTHKAIQELGDDKLIHVYGPTETTVFASYHRIRAIDIGKGVVPIGKPISNTVIYLFDKFMKLVPKGVLGEIYIGGQGNALGYLNNIELSNEKFVVNPYNVADTLYKTGDLGRMLSDGSIEFIGRIDHQVKIRGFRVELGEIESCLLKHPLVNACVVLDKEENGDKYLCAYVVCEGEVNDQELRRHLSVSLPDYMIPSYYVHLEQLPLTSNGKVDHRSLPSPEYKAGSDYEAPSNALESKLAKIWSEVLSIPEEEISVTANFFTIGGHSLKATVLTGRIYKEVGVEFPLREVFVHPTIRAQAIQIGIRNKKTFESIPKAKIQDYYPLSSAQKRLYLLQQIDLDSVVYNMPYTISLDTGIDRSRVEGVFRQLIFRHESFRTSFEVLGEVPVQRVHEKVDFKVEAFTIEKSEELDIRSKFIQAFDLSRAPLLRVAIVGIKGEGSFLLLDMHHIISDGVSHGILEREFQQLYQGEALSPLRLQYKDYSEWQNSEYQLPRIKEQESYWLRKFEGELPVLNLPTDYIRPVVQSHEGATVKFVLSEKETFNIKRLAEKNGLTLNMSLVSVFTLLLSKVSGQKDIIVGMPIAGRKHPDLENIVGMFVNTLAIRNEVKGGDSLNEFVSGLKQTMLEAYENQDYQFEDLVDRVSSHRDTSRNPLFDVMLNLLNQREYAEDLSGIDHQERIHTEGISKFDLTLIAVDYGEQLLLSIEYCRKLFKADTIERYISYFKQIVNQIAGNPEIAISEIEIISAEEKQRLLYEFNDIKGDYPRSKTVHQLFEDQVERTPNKFALTYAEQSITYKELDTVSNQLAHLLLEKGVKDEEIIGIIVERGFDVIISILGILKAGCAYLPLDVEYPKERISYILENSRVEHIITKGDQHNINFNREIICVDIEGLSEKPITKPAISNNSDNLLYVIYTSGTTGNPKGVLIEHRSVVNLLVNKEIQFDFNQDDVWTMFHSHCFDFSVWEMYGALLYGGRLVVIPKMLARDASEYLELLKRERVTVLNQTPSAFYSLIAKDLESNECDLSLRYVIFGGEALHPARLKDWNRKYPAVKLVNMFGITETTVHVTFKNITDTEIEAGISNIGRAIPGLSTYILDENMKLQPVGIPGVLYVGGEGLSRGYIRNPELTNERFKANPYHPEEKLYYTGDLVRWLSNCDIEYLGRIDDQVQLRGFRIEMGEIENVLLKHESIKECVVVVREEKGDKYLCAYIVYEGEFSLKEIRSYLLSRLPDYMIPSYFVEMGELPLTSNGKVNRKALLPPEVKAGDDYVAPANEVEEQFVEIWADVLNIPAKEISTNVSFFELGGDSIKAIMISSRIQNYGYNLKVKDIFQYPRIIELSSRIEKISDAVTPQGEIKGDILFTAIQKWFLDLKFDSKNHFNHSVMLFSKAGFDKNRLKTVIKEITSHHDALRIVFKNDNGAIRQENQSIDAFSFDIAEYDLKGESDLSGIIQSYSTKLQQSIDLNHGPLIKLGLFHCDEGSHLLIIIHHLVIDGVSWRIFLEDFNKLYHHSSVAESYKLPLKTASFKEWCDKQHSYSVSAKLLDELSYWESIKLNAVPALPVDKLKLSGNTRLAKDRDSISVSITEEQTENLLKNCNHIFNTNINDILLSALALALHEWANITKISINLEGHGREILENEINISRTMGWFTSQFPIVLTLTKPEDLFYSIIEIKEMIRKIPNKGLGYGILRYLTPPEHKENYQLIGTPEVAFNFLGEFNEFKKNDDDDVLFSNMPTGTSISADMPVEQKLELNGIVINKKLQVSFLYNKLEFEESTIRTIALSYQKHLLNIIKYCIESEDPILTPSDYLFNEISVEKLFEIKSKYDIEEVAPLSKMQKAILFQTIYNEGSTIFYQQSSYKVNHTIDTDVFKKSIAFIISNHQILRANFIYKNVVEPFHIISKRKEADIRVYDLSLLTPEKRREELANLKASDLKEGFDLSKDCLFRAYLIKLENQLYEIIFSSHHIMMDGWSYHILMQEFVDTYDKFLNKVNVTRLSDVDFIDYLKWIDKKNFKTSEIFWKEYLAGYELAISFPKNYENNLFKELSQNRKERFVFEIQNSQFERLSKLSKMFGVTINTLFQLLWGIVICKYNGKNDCVFGATDSGRPEEINGIDTIIGLFINVLPVRVHFPSDMPFNVFLNRFKDAQRDSSAHRLLPLAEIQQLSCLKQKLIDHVVGFQNYNSVSSNKPTKNNLEIHHDEDFEHLVYDLMVMVAPTPSLLHVELFYHPELYSIDLIKNIPEHFNDAINQIFGNQSLTFNEIILSNASPKAKSKIINDIEGTFNF